MANYHLKDRRLSLKAKGLLSVMLSLPDGWNYNMKGLARLSKDGLDSVRSTVNELERIDLFPEKREDGCWIRNIVFTFPVPIQGYEVKELPLEKSTLIETVCLLSRTHGVSL